jgi:hypothetical protein
MPEPNDSAKTREVIRDLLSRGEPMTTYEVCTHLVFIMGKSFSESAVSARIRDLRKPQFGGHTVISRPRQGCTAWEYQILANRERKAA